MIPMSRFNRLYVYVRENVWKEIDIHEVVNESSRVRFKFVHGVPNMSRDFKSVVTKLGNGLYEISMMYVRANNILDKQEGLDGEPIKRMVNLAGRVGSLKLIRYSYSDEKSLYRFREFGKFEDEDVELFPEEILYP